jgi:hypothetical protein
VLAAETPLMLIRFNALLEQVNQRYPQATVKMRTGITTRWTPLRAERWIWASPDAKRTRARVNC